MQMEQEPTDNKNQKLTEKQKNILLIIGGILSSFLISFGLAFNPIWQLVILAGVIGGIFYSKPKQAALYCAIGTGLGWILYIIIQIATSSVETLIAQVTGIMFGQEYFSFAILLIIILLGAIFGLLGGILSSSIRKLIYLYKKKESVGVQ